MRRSDTATVLVVDDNEELAEAYAATLRKHYDTQIACGGQEALDVVDETVDVVLLDRRMPAVSGDEVLDRIRERGLDCRVIVVTAVDPDFDIVEMPFDEYLHKPVRGEKLMSAIDRQLDIAHNNDSAGEFVELSSKIAALEATKSLRELQNSEQVADLREQVNDLEASVELSVRESRVQ
jgi:DNA-binding response OmpR family regulator